MFSSANRLFTAANTNSESALPSLNEGKGNGKPTNLPPFLPPSVSNFLNDIFDFSDSEDPYMYYDPILGTDFRSNGNYFGLTGLLSGKSISNSNQFIDELRSAAKNSSNTSSSTGGYSAAAQVNYGENAPLSQSYGLSAETAFSEEMANTAHQREVADLKAAGLNPVLGFNGSGASTVSASPTPSASGAVENPLNDVKDIISIIGSILKILK